MVDAVDSKSTAGDCVGVQISPPAPFIYKYKIRRENFNAEQKIRRETGTYSRT